MAENEPALIKVASSAQAGEAAFTLQYKNRFLYSKYNPQKSVMQAIQNLELLPETLVLAFSPALFYGYKELKEKCQAAKSDFLCVEADPLLHAFESQEIIRQDLAASLLPLDKNNPQGLNDFFNGSPKKFRRVIRLDLSAGAALAPGFYKSFFECAQNIVAAFWKNRLTLVRLGRLYSKNLFKNLPLAASSTPFEALEGTVEKPILVCGAGESLDELTAFAREKRPKAKEGAAEIKQTFFTLAVDAAVPALSAAGIKIDAIAATESQWAIEKAYIGLAQGQKCGQDSGPFFFFDLTSRPQIARRFYKNSAFYFSEFDNNNFLSRLAKNSLLPKIAPPLGSIGLTAVYLALLLRKNDSVPVYATGLDFSFSAGRTHTHSSAQSKALSLLSNRLYPAQNLAAAFGPGSQKLFGKDGRPVWTTKNLSAYAALFKDYFKGAKNLYDAGKSGLELGLEKASLLGVLNDEKSKKAAASKDLGLSSHAAASNAFGFANAAGTCADTERVQKVRQFLAQELYDLRALADLLSKGDSSKFRDKNISLDEQISRSLSGREYLYLHFPDGSAPSLERSFLTRVRSQIDFFAKDIETALAAAQV